MGAISPSHRRTRTPGKPLPLIGASSISKQMFIKYLTLFFLKACVGMVPLFSPRKTQQVKGKLRFYCLSHFTGRGSRDMGSVLFFSTKHNSHQDTFLPFQAVLAACL